MKLRMKGAGTWAISKKEKADKLRMQIRYNSKKRGKMTDVSVVPIYHRSKA